MTTLAEHIIVAGAENRPLMLEKSMYDSWESRIRLFIKRKKHGRIMLDSIDNGLLTEDLNAYDSDCDDISSVKVVLMANLLSYDSDVLSEVPYFDTYLNDMINHEVKEMPYFEQTHIVDFPDNEITSDSNIIPYSQYLQESQDAGIQDTHSFAPNELLVLSLVEQMTDRVANLDKEKQTNKMVNETLTAELDG
nr:hypothetical protein [Tanacetum cinerariifolium]